MTDEVRIDAVDAGELSRWLDDASLPLDDLMTKLPFLRTDAQARRFLDEVRGGIEDAAAGRLIPHEQIVAEMEQRRQARRATAAE